MKTPVRELFIAPASLALPVLNFHLSTAPGQGGTAFTYPGRFHQNDALKACNPVNLACSPSVIFLLIKQ
jgi:hypothetical protein